MSTPTTAPSSPTARAATIASRPPPEPMSITRSPGRAAPSGTGSPRRRTPRCRRRGSRRGARRVAETARRGPPGVEVEVTVRGRAPPRRSAPAHRAGRRRGRGDHPSASARASIPRPAWACSAPQHGPSSPVGRTPNPGGLEHPLGRQVDVALPGVHDAAGEQVDVVARRDQRRPPQGQPPGSPSRLGSGTKPLQQREQRRAGAQQPMVAQRTQGQRCHHGVIRPWSSVSRVCSMRWPNCTSARAGRLAARHWTQVSNESSTSSVTGASRPAPRASARSGRAASRASSPVTW
jgi:hypothetical protein